MGEYDARAVVQRRVRHDGLQRQARAVGIAFVPGQMDAIQLAIDMRDPQALSSGIGLGETACEERAGRFRSVQLERLCGTLIAHPA